MARLLIDAFGVICEELKGQGAWAGGLAWRILALGVGAT